MHSNLKSLHNKIDPACLPSNFGGKLSQADIVEYTKKILYEQRKTVLALDAMEILSTRGILSSRTKNTTNKDVTSVQGSFRKLDID